MTVRFLSPLFVTLAACEAAPTSGVATTPDGYEAVYLQIADGVTDPLNPEHSRPIAEVYGELVGDDFEAWRDAQYAWMRDTYGVDPGDPELEDRLLIQEVATGPNVAYRIVMSTADEVPPEGLPVSDLAFWVTIIDPYGMELGGEWAGTWAPPGSFISAGLYAIQRGDEVVRVPFHTVEPGSSSATGLLTSACAVEHPELGSGLALAMGTVTQGDDGLIHYEVRNTFTFE